MSVGGAGSDRGESKHVATRFFDPGPLRKRHGSRLADASRPGLGCDEAGPPAVLQTSQRPALSGLPSSITAGSGVGGIAREYGRSRVCSIDHSKASFRGCPGFRALWMGPVERSSHRLAGGTGCLLKIRSVCNAIVGAHLYETSLSEIRLTRTAPDLSTIETPIPTHSWSR